MKRKSVVITKFSGDEHMCVWRNATALTDSHSKTRPLIGSWGTGGVFGPLSGRRFGNLRQFKLSENIGYLAERPNILKTVQQTYFIASPPELLSLYKEEAGDGILAQLRNYALAYALALDTPCEDLNVFLNCVIPYEK